jgi:hypothetical protein
MEAQVALKKDFTPNDRVSLILGSVKIPEAQLNFAADD